MEYFAFQFHITDTCDQRCEHCYIFSEGHPKLIEMPLERCRLVIEKCEQMCRQMNRLPYFYMTGGDPILHRHFWDILAILKEKNIPFTLMGNPFHLTPEVCQRMKSYGCDKYQLSIDGLRDTHDFIRKPGSYDCTLSKISGIRDAGIKCAIMATVSGTNIKEMPQVLNVVVEHEADIFAFGRYCPTSQEKDVHIAPLEYRDFLQVMWDKYEYYRSQNVNTYFNLKDHLWTLFLYEKGIYKIPEWTKPNVIYDGCNCGNCHFTITPTGDLMACRRFDSVVGNIFSTEPYQVFTEAVEKYRDYDRFEKCHKCELLRFCRGCPAVAYGLTHNFYAPDPQCWHE